MFEPPVCVSAAPSVIGALSELADELRPAVASLSHRLATGAERLASSLATPMGVGTELSRMSEALGDLASRLLGLGVTLAVPSAEQSRESLQSSLDRDALRLPPAADLATTLNTFARYDDYFGTRRLQAQSSEQFLLQLLTTAQLVFEDLPRCLLDLHEIVALVRGLEAAVGDFVPGSDELVKAMEADSLGDNVTLDWRSCETDVRSLALWRWKVGHHLFNAFAIASLHLISAARNATDSDMAARIIDRLCRTYRGTTAAMWYAEAFPPNLYVDLVRPSMEAASPSGSGFSGTDNLEFRMMKPRLRDLLRSFGPEVVSGDESERLFGSMWHLYEVQVLDLEHHVLIAEKVVGNAPSLKQKRVAEISSKVDLGEISGVDMLRAMVRERAAAKSAFLAG